MRRFRNNKEVDLRFFFRKELSTLVSIGALSDFRKALKLKQRNPLFQSTYFFNRNRFKLSGFGGDNIQFPSSNLEYLLSVIFDKINREKKLLNNYISKKEKYEELILNGDYCSALEVVEEIGKESGYSFWYLEAKFSTLSLLEDVDEIRSFYDKVASKKLTDVEQRDLDLIFDRTSPISKVERISYSLDSLKDGLAIDDAIDSYIIDFMHRFNCSNKYNSTQVLSYYWQCNIVDIYNAVLRLIFTESIDFSELDKSLYEEFKSLKESIKDKKLSNYFVRADGCDDDLKDCYLKMCDLYIYGDYHGCKEFYENNFNNNPLVFSLYELYINSLINLGLESGIDRNGVLRKIIDHAIISGSKYEKKEEIDKLFYMLNHIDALQYSCLREEKRVVNFEKQRIEKIYRYFECTSFPSNPFNPNNCYENCISSKITLSSIDTDLGMAIPEYRNKKRIADFYFHRKDFSSAIKVYLSINDAPEHMKDEISNKIILCHFYNNEISKACVFICDLYFNGMLNINRIDGKKILEVMEECEPPEETSINIPIAVYLIASNLSEDQVIALYLDDFLDFSNVEKPSELSALDEKHRFLMHKVCNLNVLESLHTVRNIYASSSDRLLDRMLILSKLDSNDMPEIKKEIKFLTTQYSRNLCVKDVGGGKININFEVLLEIIKEEKSLYIENMNDAYYREKDDFDFDFDCIEKQKNTDIYNSVYEFLSAVRDVYSLDGKYGLDYQLNTKIRHNGIVPAIRSIFEKEGILCKRLEGKYIDNEKFEHECKHLLLESSYNTAQQKIKYFSKHIDTRLSKLKSVYMQIMTNDKTEKDRLFRFPITGKDIASFILYLDSDRTKDDYVIQALELMKSKTNSCLSVGRALIAEGLANDFSNELKELKNSFRAGYGKNYKSALSLVLNDIDSKLLTISEWLSFSEVIGENFKLDVAIFEAENFTKTIFPQVNLNVSVNNEEELIFDGKHLDSFVHMFILLFENASKRRKEHSFININVSITLSQHGFIEMRVSNESSSIDLEELERINSEINNLDFLHNANREKRSGVFKVKKILELDFQCRNKVILEAEKDIFTFVANLDVSNLIEGDCNE
ncbi:hypothetical protein JG663_09225 [Vibrio cholerae]|uniref:hypothetical protein n=1 Tax=Vibrio cholerae TaxID=666 RepID=UPI0018F10340|nr:hypothetical protein [Vibrio cholerae]MBJ6879867.1 hypothetical protein [Vibrio cholerae]MBJ6883584.1 hypothetical protein [Vibrio cholerae]MBJ6891086.1 hypothetical protein [Vibrio cholerae]